jgi:hypothetical protein
VVPNDKEYPAVRQAKKSAADWFAEYGTSVTVQAKKIHRVWRLEVNIRGLVKSLEHWPRQFGGYPCDLIVDGVERR